ncbi:MAG: peptidylprolyl isomerase [Anaerolineaceae bacterium]|nr:peptidylprolyl isomerase [Anaerolineaceae bacterium]
MKRIVLIVSLLFVLLVSACSQGAEVTEEVQEEAPAAVEEAETETEAEPESEVAVEDPVISTNLGEVVPATCRPYRLLDYIISEPSPSYVPPSDDDWVMGSENPALTIVEYSEAQCPYCAMLEPELLRLVQTYPDDVQLVFRHFPLSGHDKALLAAQSMEAAGMQGEEYFYMMKELLFVSRLQEIWSDLTPEDFKVWVADQAGNMGLDAEKFVTDLDDPAILDKIWADFAEGEEVGVTGTPFVFINGTIYQQQRSFDVFEAILNLYKLQERQFEACPELTIDQEKIYQATITTDKGEIVMDLYPDKAPFAVNSFVFLAENGWFDGVTFHRVIADFVAQTGDPTGTGAGGPGYAYSNELNDLSFDKAGVLGMANAGPDSNGSQFFITLAARPELDGGYTIFGQVVEGLEVVEQLTVRDIAAGGDLPDGDIVLSVTVEEK